MIIKLENRILPHTDDHDELIKDGAFSFLYWDEPLLGAVKKYYGRENQFGLAIKVFHYPLIDEPVNDYIWGKTFGLEDARSPLRDATIAQNLMAYEMLAPRVYGLFVIEFEGRHYPAQLVQLVDGEEEKDRPRIYQAYMRIKEKLESVGIRPMRGDIVSNNLIGGQWVDFQGAKLTPDYVKGLKKRFQEKAIFGDAKPYQDCPELGIDGDRKTEIRIKDLGLDQLDFEGKTVLDIGSSGGSLCNYAAGRGAKRVVGIDFKDQMQAARELSNYLGYYNIDYGIFDLTYDLTTIIHEPFDIVFYLSMTKHTRYPDYVNDLTRETLVLEYNRPEKRTEPTLKQVEKKMRSNFRKVEKLGMSTDYKGRPIYHCEK